MHRASSGIAEVPYCFSRPSIKFQGHTSWKINYFDLNWVFPHCNSTLIHRWLWNNAQSLKWHRRGALLFSEDIHQISRSQLPKNLWFGSHLSVSRRQLQFEFIHGYEVTHKASGSINDVPCCFSRSSVKIQGHTGWNIDLNLIIYINWARLQGQSQLSNPSDLLYSLFLA